MSLAQEAFRDRQTSAELSRLSYKPLKVTWTDIGKAIQSAFCSTASRRGPTFTMTCSRCSVRTFASSLRIFWVMVTPTGAIFFDRSLLAQTAMIIPPVRLGG